MRIIEETVNMLKWRAVFSVVTCLVIGAATATAAQAQSTIQSITSTQQAGTEVVRIELSEALAAVPTGFSTQAPPRIAIDLPGVGNAMGRNSVEINQGNLRSVNVAQAGDRTRLVLNLKQASGFRAQLQGKALVLVLDATSPGSSGEVAHFAPPQNAEPQGRAPEPQDPGPAHRLL